MYNMFAVFQDNNLMAEQVFFVFSSVICAIQHTFIENTFKILEKLMTQMISIDIIFLRQRHILTKLQLPFCLLSVPDCNKFWRNFIYIIIRIRSITG